MIESVEFRAARIRFENFERDIIDVIEQHFDTLAYGSDQANDLAWRIGQEHAYRIMVAMIEAEQAVAKDGEALAESPSRLVSERKP